MTKEVNLSDTAADLESVIHTPNIIGHSKCVWGKHHQFSRPSQAEKIWSFFFLSLHINVASIMLVEDNFCLLFRCQMITRK